MRVLIFVLVLAGLALWPFVALRQPWAVRIWERFKLLIIIYVVVIAAAAVVGLILRWDQIYG
ncbi:MAG TPA: hypothetical protein VNN10_12905 [Dehalococcoidia bacterium]|nr:hypothetical protein [Dehalococcoidia bacterium]